MDFLKQTKLIKSEWDSLEVPCSEKEVQILCLIRDGYQNPKLIHNHTINMIGFTKLAATDEMHYFIFTKYFQPIIDDLKKKYDIAFQPLQGKGIKKLKSGDSIRVQNVDQSIHSNMEHIYEFVCMEMCKQIWKKSARGSCMVKELYTLLCWTKATIAHNNPYVIEFVHCTIAYASKNTSIDRFVYGASQIIEKNPDLERFQDISLYSHQRDMFHFCKMHTNKPKLILYTAPTGTGKTLTPIGLSQGYKIIFVCVARHIGLSLAKSAISIGKKVAFAFGCETASDIRLHYFAAIDYERNKRSGGIGKVDNSNGSAVEIMICDVQSYLVAMYYMMSFNDSSDLMMYWDEPTMTLDYETHELHDIIHNNWNHNKIPNVVLSCATLPNEEHIQPCIHDFRAHFMDAQIHTITSFDCKKSIPMITTDGFYYTPHSHCRNVQELTEYANFCEENKTLLRYFDVEEVVRFIQYMHQSRLLESYPIYTIEQYFEKIEEVSIHNIKLYYLKLLSVFADENIWNNHHHKLVFLQKPAFDSSSYTNKNDSSIHRMQSLPNQDTNTATDIVRFNSESNASNQNASTRREMALKGVRLTTKDAYTLTDGPTIYLADNLINLAKFYVQDSKIPDFLLNQLKHNIEKNNDLRKTIEELETQLAQKLQVKDNESLSKDTHNKKTGSSKTNTREKSGTDENTQVLKDNIQELRKQIIHLSLHKEYLPNTIEHQQKWSPYKESKSNVFRSNVDEATVKEIMDLDIDNSYKMLVLMGIGVLIEKHNQSYEEIVKRLAQEQRLYLILASSDFIYGTNYQFCHGFIGKDLPNMTPQKILQSMGRIGRNSSQQEYSVRFRNDTMIHTLFSTPEINREAINMNHLLQHND